MGEERSMKRLSELRNGLSSVQMAEDGAAYVDFLLAQKTVTGGKAGVVGYCFTGQMSMRTAAACPDRIGAAASFHGGGLYTDQSDSPHLGLPKVKARLYFGHAIEDRSMPAEAIAKLERALREWGGKFESEMYQARHGWAVPGSPVYDEKEANRHFENLVKLFDETLK
jgi:carboxymethylenebutenolidase